MALKMTNREVDGVAVVALDGRIVILATTGATTVVTSNVVLVAYRRGAMSAFGTKRTSNYCPAMSAFGGKADINGRQSNVCF